MPEESFQEKTEPASPRKRREAREEGQVAKSTEVSSTVVLLFGIVSLRIFSGHIMGSLTNVFEWVWSRLHIFEFTLDQMPGYIFSGLIFLVLVLGPLMITLVIAALASNLLQVGFMFSGKAITPKYSKIDPLKGIKRLFSMKSLVEVAKGIFKILIVGYVGYITIRSELATYPYLIDQSIAEIVHFVGIMSYKLGIRTCMVLIVLAALDYAYQKFEFEKSLRMTKQEVKEEYKRTEGDPMVKSRIRAIQRERARQRMLSDVPEADVVLTNPTHLAVALKYDAEKSGAPVVVAKGARLIAEKIKTIAREHNVPVIENKPLARLLYKTVKIGADIPMELYQAVAEILAYVYKLKNNR